jgi:hypothetical protein
VAVQRLGGKPVVQAPAERPEKPARASSAQPAPVAPGGWQPKGAPVSPAEGKLRALETATRPVRADELAGVFVELRAAAGGAAVPQPTLDRLRQRAEKSIDEGLANARGQAPSTELKSVFAEDLGKLLVLARGCLENRHQPPASLAAREGQVRDFMLGVANERVADFKALAQRAGADPAGAIRDAEGMKVSLQGDLARIYRYGFDAPRLDADRLALDVSEAAVKSFGRR